jgi:hypothetical protein
MATHIHIHTRDAEDYGRAAERSLQSSTAANKASHEAVQGKITHMDASLKHGTAMSLHTNAALAATTPASKEYHTAMRTNHEGIQTMHTKFARRDQARNT